MNIKGVVFFDVSFLASYGISVSQRQRKILLVKEIDNTKIVQFKRFQWIVEEIIKPEGFKTSFNKYYKAIEKL